MSNSAEYDIEALLQSEEVQGMILADAIRLIGEREKARVRAEEARLVAEFEKFISEQSAAMRMALRDSHNSS
jgi:hypothetical protein